MDILHLTLKKKWFDMILSGEKKEEYREIKPYWINRLTWHEFHNWSADDLIRAYNACPNDICKSRFYDVVRFTNGYGKNAPSFDIECKFIQISQGMMIWGAEKDREYFVISLGEVLLNNVLNDKPSVATEAK
jgi:hypothetical protein